jgi:methyl-accepting chemotaxis protein
MSSNPQQQGSRKPGLNSVISWGASVVIIGLMFKILHWQGGEYMIGLGLATESLLFAILGFAAMDVKTADAAPGQKASDINDLLSTAITPKVINELSAGFAQFNKTVAAVNQVTASFDATKNLIKEFETTATDIKKFRDGVASVGSGFDSFNKSLQSVGQLSTVSQQAVTQISTTSQQAVGQITAASKDMISHMNASSQSMVKDFESASAGMKSFSKNVVDMNASFDQFNKTLGAINQMTASSATMMKEFEAATAGMRAYSKNLNELAKIYQAQLDAFRKN